MAQQAAAPERPPAPPAPALAAAPAPVPTPPAPPADVKAQDRPKDGGDGIIITWKKSADDGAGANNVSEYIILRSESRTGPQEEIGRVPAGTESFEDVTQEGEEGTPPKHVVEARKDYFYKVLASAGPLTAGSEIVGPVEAYPNWFNWKRLNVLVGSLLCSGLVLYFIYHAGRGKELYIRPIAGLQAVDDAIGRATEMGRPALFVSGLDGISSIATIAAMTILGRIARRAAKYDTRMIVPCNDPVVMVAEREIVRQSYMDAGRPDAFNPDDIFFVTSEQFAYVAAVDGIMLRERPAANFYMGGFYAESLILAETGAMTDAIQIAGTDAVTQIPFFVTACDYTLMGEELYAATAYLEREPRAAWQPQGARLGQGAICRADRRRNCDNDARCAARCARELDRSGELVRRGVRERRCVPASPSPSASSWAW
jgi:hypothetical protein